MGTGAKEMFVSYDTGSDVCAKPFKIVFFSGLLSSRASVRIVRAPTMTLVHQVHTNRLPTGKPTEATAPALSLAITPQMRCI